jgi:hypothetical protein
MLKQKICRLKKMLTILLAVLFVLSVITVAASAHGGGHWGGWGGYGPGCMWVGGNNWLCPTYLGMPYTIQTTAPAEPAKAPDPSPNLAGATLFPETASKDQGTSPATGAPVPPDSSASPSPSAS